MNNHQIKEINNNTDRKCEFNMDILSSIKSIPNKTISFGNNEVINNTNFINCSYQEQNISQKNIYSSTTNKNFLPQLSKNNQNLEYPNYFGQLPDFKHINLENKNPFYYSCNYFLNINPSYNFYIDQNNCSPLFLNYNINNNYFYSSNLSPLIINNFFRNNESSDKYILLNKKRISEEINSKNSKDLFNNTFEIKENEKCKEKSQKRKKYYCKHNGCDIGFRTKKLANFHHLKMSPECQEDSIYILKLIYRTKKLLLKNIKNNKKSFDEFSSIYENSLKDLSLYEYIKIYSGFKIKDNL